MNFLPCSVVLLQNSLRDVVKVESLRQLEVKLDGGTLVRATEGIHYHYVNLTKLNK